MTIRKNNSKAKFKTSLSSSSRRWLKAHVNDAYVKRAQSEGYLSRAVYKLVEINDKHNLLESANNIVELGSAPGGWTQWLSENSGTDAKIIALDILKTASFAKVKVIQGDFNHEEVQKKLVESINGKANLILSDLSVNHSGVKVVDIARNMNMSEMCINFADNYLQQNGHLLLKIFQGSGFDELVQSLRKKYTSVKLIKPKASRSTSREMYLLGKFKK